jgi:ribonuclease PH
MTVKIRPIKFQRSYTRYAEGSVLVSMGNTQVLCNATVSPRSTSERTSRDAVKGKINGRAHEIQRLIGRSLRSVVNFEALGERQIVLDCDVIQADGGTRTASVNGAYVALVEALTKLKKKGVINAMPLREPIGAISVGLVAGKPTLDLNYEQDSTADVDLNIVMTGSGKFVEIQGTAEKEPFSRSQLDELLKLAEKGILQVMDAQAKALRK